MIIYNIGLPRTGTKSITHLMKGYGFNIKHPNITNNHNFDYNYLINNKDQWNIDNTFYSNTPVWHPEFWNLLNISDHKIICTHRDKDGWIKSMLNYKYFQKNRLIRRDIYWFNSYFINFNENNLSKIYDKHKLDTSKLNNVLYVDIVNDDDINNTIKICDFLDISYDESIILGKYK